MRRESGFFGNTKGYMRNLINNCVTFFFTNFPEEVKCKELWLTFARFGRVGDVFIPSKRDKRCKCFGFVRFRDVLEAQRLQRVLGDVWLGTYKLKVNLSIKTIPIGGPLVLLQSAEKDAFQDLIKHSSDWYSSWFIELRKWRPDDVSREHFLWISVFGDPLQIWN